MRFSYCLIVFTVLGLAAPPASPDIVILNARVFTGDRAHPWAEAVAILGGRITAVGSSSDVRRLVVATTRVVDGGGRLLIPGINDAHTHPGGMAHTPLEGPPVLEHDPTLEEVLKRIEAAVAKAPPAGWIFGEIGATVLENPKATRAVLDGVSAGHPLLLTSWTGHGAIANTAALRALRIREDEPDPPGGRFARGADGRTLTGLAHEYADYLLWRRVAMLVERDENIRWWRGFGEELASFGITSVQGMMTAYSVETASEDLTGIELPVRLRLIEFPLTSMTDWRPATSARPRALSPLITITGTKWILDGTPVERLMFLRAPYADDPGTRGAMDFSDQDLRVFLRRALQARVQPMLHAVGDGAIGAALDALEATGGARWKPLRPRIEHGDLFGPEDFERAKRMGVIIVQNPSHFMIRQLMDARLGPQRARRAARVKDIVAAGVPFALGSDGPLNPFLNMMFAAVNANNPEQALTVQEALIAYTAGSAAAEFAESEKGMLKTGMLADMALLSQDIFKAPLADLPKTTSVLTMVNGRIVHDRLSR
jgi:predicted amidohydrolase YtcJ